MLFTLLFPVFTYVLQVGIIAFWLLSSVYPCYINIVNDNRLLQMTPACKELRCHRLKWFSLPLPFVFWMVFSFIENTRWVSFHIKFTRQGFENACRHREACRAIQHAFSKPSLVNLISEDVTLVFFLSVYKMIHCSNWPLWCNYLFSCQFNVIDNVIQEVKRHDDLIKAHAMW